MFNTPINIPNCMTDLGECGGAVQILETTAALMKAQSEEDAKGGSSASTSISANEARRWTGVRTIVEARSLLKSLFRAAAGHKAQV